MIGSDFSIVFLIPLLLIGGIGYLIFRPRDKEPNAGRDAYFYIVAMISLFVLYWGISDLLRLILNQLWNSGSSYTSEVYRYGSYGASNTDLLRNLAGRISAIIIALPFWAFHWFKASGRRAEEMDNYSRRIYSIIILILSSTEVMIGGTILVYQAVTALLGVNSDTLGVVAGLLPYTTGAVILWTLHYPEWKKSGKSVSTVSE